MATPQAIPTLRNSTRNAGEVPRQPRRQNTAGLSCINFAMPSLQRRRPLSQPVAVLRPLLEWARRRTELTAAIAGQFGQGGRTYEITRFRFAGPDAGQEPIRLG